MYYVTTGERCSTTFSGGGAPDALLWLYATHCRISSWYVGWLPDELVVQLLFVCVCVWGGGVLKQQRPCPVAGADCGRFPYSRTRPRKGACMLYAKTVASSSSSLLFSLPSSSTVSHPTSSFSCALWLSRVHTRFVFWKVQYLLYIVARTANTLVTTGGDGSFGSSWSIDCGA